MTDNKNIKDRIQKAIDLKTSLEEKLKKVEGTPREEEFRKQVEKLDDLINHLRNELDDN